MRLAVLSLILIMLPAFAGCHRSAAPLPPMRVERITPPLHIAGSESSDELVVATYNLHAQSQPSELANDLRQIDADVLLLQEVFLRDSRGIEALSALLPAEVAWHAAVVRVNPLADGAWEGQAIISRYPILQANLWPMSTRGNKRRVALAAVLDVGEERVRVINVDHEPGFFMLGESGRLQVDDLIERLAPANGPTLVGGDFNTLGNLWRIRLGGSDVRHLTRAMKTLGFEAVEASGASFAWGPLRLRLDHLFVRSLRVIEVGVERRSRGSDHRPVWVRLAIDDCSR